MKFVSPIFFAIVLLLNHFAVAADPPPKLLNFGTPAGTLVYQPGEWSMVGVGVVNPRDEELDVLSTVHFGGHPELQFGRRFWIPPQARRFTWFPIRSPEAPPQVPNATDQQGNSSASQEKKKDDPRKELVAILMYGPRGEEALSPSSTGEKFHSTLIRIEATPSSSAMIGDTDDEPARYAMQAARQARGLLVSTPDLLQSSLPPTVETLDALDHLVLASDRIVEDAAALAAIRRWLYNGGRMWIMLDQVSPATVSALLEQGHRHQYVDRTQLSNYRITSNQIGNDTFQGPEKTFEEPVDFVRVLVDASVADVVFSVGDWPAAWWQQTGKGDVLFTTLGAKGWYHERTAEDPQVTETLKRADKVADAPLDKLAARLMEPRASETLAAAHLKPYVEQQIGYQILPRSRIAWVLGFFCLVLAGASIALIRGGRLEWFGLVGPATALVAAGLLIAWGQAARQSVPPTAAEVQLVEFDPDTGDMRGSGVAGLYLPDAASPQLGAASGGLLFFDLGEALGSNRRLIWTDLDRWHWENLQMPAGVHSAPFTSHGGTPHPVRATASLTAEGIAGTLAGDIPENLQDAIITTPARRILAVELQENGKFSSAEMLPSGQYLSSTVVSDEQRRRQQVYQELLKNPLPAGYANRSLLLAWAEALPTGFQYPADSRRVGSALVVIPLEMQAPRAGTAWKLSPGLLQYNSIPFPGKTGTSATYDNRKQEWIGPLTSGTKTLLRFPLPREVLPATISSADLHIRLSIPGREVKILGLADDEQIELASFHSPVGSIDVPIDDPRVLKLDDTGGLRIGITVSELPDQADIQTSGWKIEDLWLGISGKTEG